MVRKVKNKTKKVIDFDLKKEDDDMEMKWYEKLWVKVSQNPIATGVGVGVAIIGATVLAILMSGGSESSDSTEIEWTDDESDEEDRDDED